MFVCVFEHRRDSPDSGASLHPPEADYGSTLHPGWELVPRERGGGVGAVTGERPMEREHQEAERLLLRERVRSRRYRQRRPSPDSYMLRTFVLPVGASLGHLRRRIWYVTQARAALHHAYSLVLEASQTKPKKIL
jgi:hypothetical protein